MLLDEYECDFSAKIWYKDMRGRFMEKQAFNQL